MSQLRKRKGAASLDGSPTVVVRSATSKKRPVVTPAMKERLRANARNSKRTKFPELPEWRREK